MLILLALLGIPAVALATAVGALLTGVGLPPARLPTVLFARGDAVVFAAAFLLGVAGLSAMAAVTGDVRPDRKSDSDAERLRRFVTRFRTVH
ncbi:hypothetical protein [Halogeometricum rufum]|uniref:hypothetical protein n=1 Tax=Halogeometricum rufum TaxID=553469 RepID=UPI00116096D3|nr:hypothetical protein [Halogeometricum rufum]